MSTQTDNIFRSSALDEKGRLLVLDEALQTRNAGLCNLFMNVEESGIQIALKESANGKFLALESFQFPAADTPVDWRQLLEQVSSDSKLLRNYEFNRPVIGVVNPDYTFVPEALFRIGDENSYYNFNLSGQENIEIQHHHSESLQLYTVYALNTDLLRELNHLFEHPMILHFAPVMLEGIHRDPEYKQGQAMILIQRHQQLDIIVFENKKFLFMNSFRINGPEDTLYYTLYVAEQLNLEPGILKAFYLGEGGTESAAYALLAKYLPGLQTGKRPKQLAFSYGFNDIPEYYFHPLFNLALCE